MLNDVGAREAARLPRCQGAAIGLGLGGLRLACAGRGLRRACERFDEAPPAGMEADMALKEPAPAGTAIRISLPRGEIVARVQACIPEGHYGYLLQVEVGRRQEWFGGRYTPSYILCDHSVRRRRS